MAAKYTFQFQFEGQTRHTRRVKCYYHEDLMDRVDECVVWASEGPGRTAKVYGPGIRTTVCSPDLVRRIDCGSFHLPLK